MALSTAHPPAVVALAPVNVAIDPVLLYRVVVRRRVEAPAASATDARSTENAYL